MTAKRRAGARVHPTPERSNRGHALDADLHTEFYTPYTVQVPAGGTAAPRFAYVQDWTLSDVNTLAQHHH